MMAFAAMCGYASKLSHFSVASGAAGQQMIAPAALVDRGSKPFLHHLPRMPPSMTGSLETQPLTSFAADYGVFQAALADSRILGFHVDSPLESNLTGKLCVRCTGWLVIKDAPEDAYVEVKLGDYVINRLELKLRRPDVISKLGMEERYAKCGFSEPISLFGTMPEAELTLTAVWGAGHENSVLLAKFNGPRPQVDLGFEMRIQPMMVNMMQRTGSTLMMNVLLGHSQFSVYPRYPSELMYAVAQLFCTQCHLNWHPADPATTTIPRHTMAGPTPAAWLDPVLMPELENGGPIRILQAAARNIEEVYLALARKEGKEGARWFSEKVPRSQCWPLMHHLFPNARCVFLVRDPRDLESSRISWAMRRGDPPRPFRFSEFFQYMTRFRQTGANAYLVRYEDMILRPEKALGGFAEFMGLPDESELMDSYRKAQQIQSEHGTSSDAGASLGRWQRDLPEEQRRRWESGEGAQLLEMMGYA